MCICELLISPRSREKMPSVVRKARSQRTLRLGRDKCEELNSLNDQWLTKEHIHTRTHTQAQPERHWTSHDCSSVIVCWLLFHLIYFGGLLFSNLLNQQQSKHYMFCICADALHYILLLYYYYIFYFRCYSEISHGHMEILYVFDSSLVIPLPSQSRFPDGLILHSPTSCCLRGPLWSGLVDALVLKKPCSLQDAAAVVSDRKSRCRSLCIILLFPSSCFSPCDSHITFLHNATLWSPDKSTSFFYSLERTNSRMCKSTNSFFYQCNINWQEHDQHPHPI